MHTETVTQEKEQERKWPEKKRDAVTRKLNELQLQLDAHDDGILPKDTFNSLLDIMDDLVSILEDTEKKWKATVKRSNNRHKAIKAMERHTAKVVAENAYLKKMSKK